MNWVLRPPRWVNLFGGVMVVGAVLAAIISIWPMLHGNAAAYGMAAIVLFLSGLYAFKLIKNKSGHGIGQAQSLRRIAAGQWQVAFDDGRLIHSRVRHAWRGWGWITLRLQPYDQKAPAMVLTVWRDTVPVRAWHQLCVWTVWELAMTRSLTQTEA